MTNQPTPLSVRCPSCGSKPGTRCTMKVDLNRYGLNTPHDERVAELARQRKAVAQHLPTA